MYTLAPFCTSAAAIIEPSPEPPPVTNAIFPKQSQQQKSMCQTFEDGKWSPCEPLTLNNVGIRKSMHSFSFTLGIQRLYLPGADMF
jgi:hypothetical protein